MKTPLNISVLDCLARQEASRFPIQHTELPEFGVTELELLHELARLEQAGFIDARVVLGGTGQPVLGAVMTVTLQGKDHLEKWTEDSKAKSPLRKMSRWVILGIGLVLGGVLAKSGEFLFELLQRKVVQP